MKDENQTTDELIKEIKAVQQETAIIRAKHDVIKKFLRQLQFKSYGEKIVGLDKRTKCIPQYLLDATFEKEKYFAAHLEYISEFNLSSKSAWEKLESDLEEHGLPRRYNNVKSFYENRRKLIKKYTDR